MTRKVPRSRPPHDTARRIAIPHSSWSNARPSQDGNAVIAPDEFWSRLGL